MPKHITAFDTRLHHIHVEFLITNPGGITHSVAGILDTGAPRTEFSDQFLMYAGCLESTRASVMIPKGLQTHKYAKLRMPMIEICGHTMRDFEVAVSSFEPSWGIDALIGLDFFRRVLTTIDYQHGILLTEPYGSADE